MPTAGRDPAPVLAASSFDVIVLGAGALGLAVAAKLGATGRAVCVVDPGGPNASSVAAGMIAPALEAVLEGCDRDRAALLRRAASLWPDFADRFGLTLYREDTDWVGPDPEERLSRLVALGFEGRIEGEIVRVRGDARVEPVAALAILTGAEGVGRIDRRAVEIESNGEGWSVDLDDGRRIAAPHLVMATGAASAVAGLPEPIAGLIHAIQPIRGQLLEAAGKASHVRRSTEGYAAPGRAGRLLIGATMEVGRRDLAEDAETTRRHRCLGQALTGAAVRAGTARVGVRGASPDGLPMAGSVGRGLHLALAPRRNGWLLAPMVARAVTAGVEDRPAPEPALDPVRLLRL